MTGQHERDSAEPAALPVAGYMPVHDPAVHGEAVAVKHEGQDTRPFAAIRPDDEPCRCDDCKYEQGPRETGKDALLYYGPGIATRNWEAKVREGAWADIPAVLDAAHARVHMPAVRRYRHISRDLSNGVHHLGAVFAAHPDWHADAELAEGLQRMEAEMPARMAELQDWVATRVAEHRRAEAAARQAEADAAGTGRAA